jgi:hypothetical protein
VGGLHVGLAEGVYDKGVGLGVCASMAVADKKSDKGSAYHDFKWTLGHHPSVRSLWRRMTTVPSSRTRWKGEYQLACEESQGLAILTIAFAEMRT